MDSPAYELRPAAREDFDYVCALRRTAYREHVIRTWGKWDESWQRNYLAGRFDPAETWIVLAAGEPVGEIEVRRGSGRIFLANICIAPGFQGRGIGTAVIRALADEARGRGVPLELEVMKVNEAARRLYERLGFVRIPCERETHFAMRLAPENERNSGEPAPDSDV